MRTKLVLLPAILVLILFALFAGCSKPDESHDRRVKKVREGNLEISMSVPKGKIHQKAEVPIGLSVKNVGSETEILSFITEQKFDLEVTDSTGKRIWDSAGTESFGVVEEQVRMEPDEQDDYDIVWGLTDFQGNPVPPGRYTLRAQSKAEEITKPALLDVEIVK